MGKPVSLKDKPTSGGRSCRKRKPVIETETKQEEGQCHADDAIERETTKQTRLSRKTAASGNRKAAKIKTNKHEGSSKSKNVEIDDTSIVGNGSLEAEFITEDRGVLPELDFKFNKRKCRLEIPGVKPSGNNSSNISHLLHNRSAGITSTQRLNKSCTSPLTTIIAELQLYRVASPFDRRVTAMEWHPTIPHIVCAGSKGGDLILWNVEATHQDLYKQGIGPGGSIQALKFWPHDDNRLLTASIDGTVVLHDLEGKKSTIVSDTMDCMESWYCSVDVSVPLKMILTGDNYGNTSLLSKEGEKTWAHRLHKSKVTHVEWSPREDWLFCTASCDQTVKLWDVRMIKGRESSLVQLKHNKPINSAYFSLTDGCRLLTTDQKNDIRIYRGPYWQLETEIQHPHRFFQHITPFKAHWHPLADLIVIGRYPDDNFQQNDLRTIDVFDAPSGGLICRLQDPSSAGLVSLNRFSRQGDSLASGMGCNILIWSRKEVLLKKQELLMTELRKEMMSNNRLSREGHSPGQGRRPRSQQKKQTKSNTSETKTKTSAKAKTKLSKK